MIRYKFKYEPPWVVAVECPKSGFPNRDADDEVQNGASHFDNEAEAWEQLLKNEDNGLRGTVDRYDSARKDLEEATKDLASEASEYAHARDAFDAWKKEHET